MIYLMDSGTCAKSLRKPNLHTILGIGRSFSGGQQWTFPGGQDRP